MLNREIGDGKGLLGHLPCFPASRGVTVHALIDFVLNALRTSTPFFGDCSTVQQVPWSRKYLASVLICPVSPNSNWV